MQKFWSVLSAVDDATRFAQWGPDSNPLICQVKREDPASRLTLRRALWGAWWLGLLGAAWATWDVMSITRQGMSTGITMIMGFGWAMLALAPLFSAMSAARLTSRQIRPEHFDLIYITPLENRVLVRARVFDALFQQRRPLMVMAALLPSMVIYAFYFFLRLDQHLNEAYYWQPTDAPAPDYWAVVGPTLWVLAIIVGQWGNVLLGAVLGVRMGIFRRSAFSSVSVALVAMILVLLTPCTCFWGLTFVAEGEFESLAAVFMYVVPVVFMVTPWMVAWKLIEHTAWIWKRE